MEKQKLYCPPSGNHPQELPDYWRFDNGIVRRDLQTLGLEDAELNAWGWDGPFYPPTAKQTIDNVNLVDGQRENLQNDSNYTLDKANNVWVTVNHEYDLKTHKVVWYSAKRKYIILPRNQDSSEYEIPFRSGATESELPVLWNQFKQSILTSSGFNEYIGKILPSLPIVVTSLPVAITSLESGKYENFRMVWGIIKENALPPVELVTSLVTLAKECSIPQDFIVILEG